MTFGPTLTPVRNHNDWDTLLFPDNGAWRMAATPLGRHFPIPELSGACATLGPPALPCARGAYWLQPRGVTGTAWQEGQWENSARRARARPRSSCSPARRIRSVTTASPRGRQPPLDPPDVARTRGAQAGPGAGTAGALEPPMSMYTQLLDAAVGQRGPVGVRPTRRSALDALRRSRGELDEGAPPADGPRCGPRGARPRDRLRRRAARLGRGHGDRDGPSRFEQPRQERARLEQVRDRGITTAQAS